MKTWQIVLLMAAPTVLAIIIMIVVHVLRG